MLRIALVLKAGGEFAPEHVQHLQAQIAEFAPGVEIVTLSDVPVPGHRIPLQYGYPGWWSKMELCRPDIKGDLLYLDLDTVVCGPLEDLLKVNRLTLLRDFYRDGIRKPEGLGSGLMLLPEADRAEAWAAWNPRLIQKYKAQGVGDQAFLESLGMEKAARWQDLLPGQVVSYKVHCRGNGVPAGTRVVCYHGKPRPWSPEGKLWLSKPTPK